MDVYNGRPLAQGGARALAPACPAVRATAGSNFWVALTHLFYTALPDVPRSIDVRAHRWIHRRGDQLSSAPSPLGTPLTDSFTLLLPPSTRPRPIPSTT